VADSSRYNAYQLVDAALIGDAPRAQKVLRGLRNEGIFPLLILGAITRELRSLLPMLQQKEEGKVISGIVQSSHVFFNRKQVVSNALHRLSTDLVWQLLHHSRLIDQSIKGMANADPWDELSALLLQLSGVTTKTA
jgi:DNA polymerase-3 subunit delta